MNLTHFYCDYLLIPAYLINTKLKGQVTFLKLCLLVVCLALIIPRFTLF